MEFLRTITAVLVYQTGSISVPLFLFSALLLAAGVAAKARANAMKLSFLEHTPLNWIEKNHPHLPSPRVIVTIALCSLTLLLAGLQTMQGSLFFNDPYQGLNLASLFLLGAAVGVLAELRWKGTRDYASALLSGTALAFLVLMILFNGPARSTAEKAFVLVLLLPSILLVGRTHASTHKRSVILTVLFAFCFWVLVYVLQ